MFCHKCFNVKLRIPHLCNSWILNRYITYLTRSSFHSLIHICNAFLISTKAKGNLNNNTVRHTCGIKTVLPYIYKINNNMSVSKMYQWDKGLEWFLAPAPIIVNDSDVCVVDLILHSEVRTICLTTWIDTSWEVLFYQFWRVVPFCMIY